MTGLIALVFLLAPSPTPPPAAAMSPAQVVDEVQLAYSKVRDVSATFSQTYVDKLRGRRRMETGQMWAKKDGRVRWSYRDPVRKDFVFDGKTAYFYEPENAQVTVFEHFEDSALSNAVRFLWGQGDLRSAFDIKSCVKKCDQGEEGDHIVSLWPKDKMPTVDHILLVVDPASYRVRASIAFDPLGNRTEYRLTDFNGDVVVADKKFAFTVPDGVSVLRAAVQDGKTPSPGN